MGIVGSSLVPNEESFQNVRTTAINLNSSIINRTDDEYLYDLMPQGPNINVQRTSAVRNVVNLRRNTLKIIDRGNNIYLITFYFDALYDVEISTFFCCKEQETVTKEIIFIPTKYKVITKLFYKGENQMYINTPDDEINFNYFDINDFKCKPSYENIIPILIILNAIGSPIQYAQFNYAYLHVNEDRDININESKYKIVLYKQKIKFNNRYFEIQEIFGIQKPIKQQPDEINNYATGSECVICLTEERDTVILPCRHMCLCNTCANVVRIHNTKCPICRQDVKGLLQISVDNKQGRVIS
ncbi:RING zinc finger protein, putative [Hepatocystis sp. ex Piliocolobus tephrosceles]|nr:RING zinc finger protein, putative [Hepatocystis sp. ex Piliocolobus tephrosceles]